MDWHQRTLNFLRDERAAILGRIELFGSGKCKIHESNQGRQVDVTGFALVDLHRRLNEIESLLAEAGIPLDDPAAAVRKLR